MEVNAMRPSAPIMVLTSLFIPNLQLTAYSTPAPRAGFKKPDAIECAINPVNVSDNGYQLDVYLANTGSRVISGWKVTLNFSNPTRITGSWNADMADISTTSVTAGHLSWNRELLPGQSTAFGIQGDHHGRFGPPICTPTEML
jgi:cellulase/cellobiase CelA1